LSSTEFSLKGTIICDSPKFGNATHFVLEKVHVKESYVFSPTKSHAVELDSHVRLVGHGDTPDTLIGVLVSYEQKSKS
jgi:hypothetical protein